MQICCQVACVLYGYYGHTTYDKLNTHTHIHIHTHTHTHTHTLTPSYCTVTMVTTCLYVYDKLNTHTHTYIHMHTHTHTHTPSYPHTLTPSQVVPLENGSDVFQYLQVSQVTTEFGGTLHYDHHRWIEGQRVSPTASAGSSQWSNISPYKLQDDASVSQLVDRKSAVVDSLTVTAILGPPCGFSQWYPVTHEHSPLTSHCAGMPVLCSLVDLEPERPSAPNIFFSW